MQLALKTSQPRPLTRKKVSLMIVLALLLSVSASFLASAVSVQAATTPSISVTYSTIRAGVLPEVNATGFVAGERIDLWLSTPTGIAYEYGFTYAANDGTFSEYTHEMKVEDGDSAAVTKIKNIDLVGQWAITARGVQSNTQASTGFVVASATLQATYLSTYQGQITATFNGSNFYPGERISLWVTDSTGKVIPAGYSEANKVGQIPALDPDRDESITSPENVFSFEGATGPYLVTAYGNTSGQTAIAQLQGS